MNTEININVEDNLIAQNYDITEKLTEAIDEYLQFESTDSLLKLIAARI